MYDLEVEDRTKYLKNNIQHGSKEYNQASLNVEQDIQDYKKLRIVYETNELFLEYFKGINSQIKRVLISDALDKNTISEFTNDLETKLEELLRLKGLIMDLEKQVKRKSKSIFLDSDIFTNNKHIYKDAKELIVFTREQMSLLEIKYANDEIKKVLVKLQNPVRSIDSDFIARIFFGVLIVLIIASFLVGLYRLNK